jgi:WD40 repeat protein
LRRGRYGSSRRSFNVRTKKDKGRRQLITGTGLQWIRAKRLAALTILCGLIGVGAFCIVASISQDHVRAQSAPPVAQRSSDIQPLPRLRLLRTLSAPNLHYYFPNVVSGTSRLAWSPDGQRLAAYTRNGAAVEIWSPDGQIQRELPRYNNAALTESNVLGFLSGHRQILVGPSANDSSNLTPSPDIAMSVLDAETGAVVRNIPGLKPHGRWQENIVSQVAISPDQKFVAAIYFTMFDRSIERRIGIYSTDDWRLITKVSFGDPNEPPQARAIAFSPDGKILAIAYEDDRARNKNIDLVEVGSWRVIRTIKAFSDATTCCLLIAAVNFNRDGSMVSVISSGGGKSWRYPDGRVAPEGVGVLADTGNPSPLQVFRVSDGVEVASFGNFTGGNAADLIAWSPRQDFIAFLDAYNVLYFWDPITNDVTKERRLARSTTSILFSPDGAMIAQGFGDGVNLYEVVNGSI